MTEHWKQRRDNLQALIDSFPDAPGNRAAFCRAYGLDPLQLGHYFTISKNARRMGERKAREIETRLKVLKAGWLDEAHGPVNASIFDHATSASEAADFISRARKLQLDYENLKSDVRTKVDTELAAGKKAGKRIGIGK